MIICVTGTNTDVGKTIATAALASVIDQAGYNVIAAKPVQTGTTTDPGDAATVTRLTGLPTVQGWGFPEPLAPNLAARRAGEQAPSLREVVQWVRDLDAPDRTVLVEGAGGLLVRIGDDYSLADVAVELDAPLVVVTSLGLGSLNLAELTCVHARQRGLDVLGLVGGAMPAEPDLATALNVEELPRVTGVPYLGSLPAGAGKLSPKDFAAMAQEVLGPHARRFTP